MLPQERYAAEYLPRLSWGSRGTAGCSQTTGAVSVMVSASCKLMASKGAVLGPLSCLPWLSHLVGCAAVVDMELERRELMLPLPAAPSHFSSLLRDYVEREVMRSHRAGTKEGL